MVAVAFHVGLVHHIDTVIVAQRIHTRVVGVVARAQGIQVVALEQQHVLHHALQGHGLSEDGMCVVAVGSLEEHTLVVHIHASALVLNFAQSVFQGAHFSVERDGERVQAGLLGAPQLRAAYVQLGHGLGALLCSKGRHFHVCFCHHAAAVEQLHDGSLGLCLLARVLYIKLHFHISLRESVVEGAGHIDVAHVCLVACLQVYVSVDAAHAEHVLVLQVAAVAPSVHLHTNEVLASGLHVFRYVKVGSGVGALGVAHLLAVDPYVCRTVDTVEVEINLLLFPSCGEAEGASVAAHGVGLVHHGIALLSLYEGRVVLEGIGDIGVDGRAVAEHFPAAGHIDGFPCAGIERGLVEVLRTLFGGFHPVELPLAVEQHAQRALGVEPGLLVGFIVHHLLFRSVGEEGGPPGQFVDAQDGRVLPVVLAAACIRHGHHFEVGLFQPPAYVRVAFVPVLYPHTSAWLTVVIVAQLQPSGRAGETVCALSRLFDGPSLVGVVGVHGPGAHFSLLIAVAGIVECHLRVGVVHHIFASLLGRDDAPHLRG